MKKERLDALLTARGLFESRARAQAAIMAGQVLVNEQKIDKPGTQVPEEAAIRLLGEKLKYVSRGGLKLEKALQIFPISVEGKQLRISALPQADFPTVPCRMALLKCTPLM